MCIWTTVYCLPVRVWHFMLSVMCPWVYSLQIFSLIYIHTHTHTCTITITQGRVCVCVWGFSSAFTPLCISACLFICEVGFSITNLYASWIAVFIQLCVSVCVFCLCVNSWHMVAILPWRQSWRKFQCCRTKAKILPPHTHLHTAQYRFVTLVPNTHTQGNIFTF